MFIVIASVIAVLLSECVLFLILFINTGIHVVLLLLLLYYCYCYCNDYVKNLAL